MQLTAQTRKGGGGQKSPAGDKDIGEEGGKKSARQNLSSRISRAPSDFTAGKGRARCLQKNKQFAGQAKQEDVWKIKHHVA